MLLERNSAVDARTAAGTLTQGDADSDGRVSLRIRDASGLQDDTRVQAATIARRGRGAVIHSIWPTDDMIEHLSAMSDGRLGSTITSLDHTYPRQVLFEHGGRIRTAEEDRRGHFDDIWDRFVRAHREANS